MTLNYPPTLMLMILKKIKFLGYSYNITFIFSTRGCLLILYFSIIISTLECTSLVWYSITSTDSKRIPSQSEETCSSLLQPIFFPYSKVHSSCNDIQIFIFNTLQVRRRKLHEIFAINIFLGHESCASSLVSVFRLGSSETSVCFVLFQPSKCTPQPGVPL